MHRAGLLAVALVVALPARAEPAKFALQAGWWNVEADITTPQGIYFGIGVPWVAFTTFGNLSDGRNVAAVDLKLGMQFRMNRWLRLRAGLQDVTMVSRRERPLVAGNFNLMNDHSPTAHSCF